MIERPAGERATRLGKEQIVDAALGLVDREGAEALSMRRVATELGVGTMSLYHYVADKAELTRCLVDRMMGEVELPQSGDWRQDAVAGAVSLRQALLSHPNVARLSFAPGAPPALLALALRVRGALQAGGLEPETARMVFHLVVRYVIGTAIGELSGPGRYLVSQDRNGADRVFRLGIEALVDGLSRRLDDMGRCPRDLD